MRKTLTLFLLVAPCACGGRTLGDWSAAASGGVAGAGGTSGGAVPAASGGDLGVGAGGRSSSGGLPSVSGGSPAAGGVAGGLGSGAVASGGFASGGFATGGFATGGSGGREACFEATQPSQGVCIHVRLCSTAQYETLCLMDTPTTAVCFCYVNGVVQSASSFLSATSDTLCDPAVAAACP